MQSFILPPGFLFVCFFLSVEIVCHTEDIIPVMREKDMT